jgi:phospholipid/cholesterol/gamma-HCH transport system substrate-binding protein
VIKEAPRLSRILAMVLFSLSVFGLLIFLWLSFGGPIPLRPEGYRLKVAFPEAATLAQEADVRLAGVNVGKVRKKELDKGGARTIVELELKPRYAPIPKDSRAILRQKTLFGETYVEISQGHKSAGTLEDGGRLPDSHVERTVELDEIFSAFDPPTRKAFQQWVSELSKAIGPGSRRAASLNDAFGNLEGFAVDGSRLLGTLDEQELAVRRLIRNTGVVFGAINERQGALRRLVVNAGNTFEATASRDAALSETFRIFPTFLDESKATMARLETFARDTRPLVRDLRGPADDLGPTIRDLGDLAPDLERLFRDLDPLVTAGKTGVPALRRVLEGADPLFEAAHPFFQELNPILSYLSFNQTRVASFLSHALINLSAGGSPTEPWSVQQALNTPRIFQQFTKRPQFDRGNAYKQPNYHPRDIPGGAIEAFTCPGGREVPDPVDTGPPGGEEVSPPCLVAPPSLFQHEQFPLLRRGKAPVVRAPRDTEGTQPAGVR